MTYSSDRLDRMEALLASTIEGLSRTEKIVESNARAIEAWGDRIEEGIAEAEEVTSQMVVSSSLRLEEAIASMVQVVANLGQQQQETDQRFNTLLAESRADRQRSEQLNAEHTERFDVFLAEARADRAEARAAREANSAEHRAFTQNTQNLLAEIARLWQRVAG